MTGVITTGNHPKALWPGIKRWWGREYTQHKTYWTRVFETDTSEKAYEEEVELTGFSLARAKNQGAAVENDSESQGYTTRYTHVTYALGYIVTLEEREDNLYEKVSRRRSGALAMSMRQTQEIVHFNILSRAFNPAYVGGNGQALISTTHPTVSGIQSNKLAVAADLSEASIEDLCIQMMDARNSRGLRIAVKPKQLVVSPLNAFNAERILKSTLQSGTTNNDVNAIKSMGIIPGGSLAVPYLTEDQDAWFLQSDVKAGMMHYTRRETDFRQDNDFDTDNAKAKSMMRFSAGWTDWRGMYGSEGA